MNRRFATEPVPPTDRTTGRRGFALLITITLLAFLVLLLVSLASLTRVETQVAANNQQLSQARQNALMALNIAVGQLQKYAGPDQRVTARADLENGATVPNARWTGVYGSAVAADYSQKPADIASALTTGANLNSTTGSSARLLTWLVSGNEKGAFSPSGDVGSSGEITATATALSTGLPFKAITAASGLGSAATTATQLKIRDKDNVEYDASMLVGPGSVSTSVSGANALDYVAAPLINIPVTEGILPGYASTNTTSRTIGRYAWWVGDEGVKARANLPVSTSSRANAYVSSARAAVELMNNNSPEYPAAALTASRISTDYDTGAQVDRILAAKQFSMAGSDAAALSSALKYRFHDLTTSSYTTLADTYAGGLKRDLSYLLDKTTSVSNSDSTSGDKTLYQPDNSSDGTSSTVGMPTWGHVRSFAQKTIATTIGDVGKIVPQLPVLDKAGKTADVGAAPVMTYMAVGIRYERAGNQLRMRYYPVVVLWNPYTAPIKGSQYEAGISITYNTRPRVQIEDPTQVGIGWRTLENRDFRYAGKVVTSSYPTDQAYEYMRFLVDAPEIAAGQSLVFTLRTSGQTYNAGQNIVEPGLRESNYAYGDGATIPAGESGQNLRVVTRYYNFTKAADGTISSSATTAGSSLSNGGGGEAYAYLGKANPTTVPTAWDPTRTTVDWYQIIQRAGFDGINIRTTSRTYTFPDGGTSGSVTESVIQDGLNLENGVSGNDPAFSIGVIAMFSANGRNAYANAGTNVKSRWIAQGNLRAPYAFRTTQDSNYNTLYIAQVGQMGLGYNQWPLFFTTDSPGDEASSGPGHDWDSATNKPVRTTLFEFRRDDQPLLSIGQLQHANLSLLSSYPAYPVGNSLADFRLNTNQIADNVAALNPLKEMAGLTRQAVYYDNSWLLNRALWDRYFFSGVPASNFSILD